MYSVSAIPDAHVGNAFFFRGFSEEAKKSFVPAANDHYVFIMRMSFALHAGASVTSHDGLIDIAIADSGIAAFFQNPAAPGTFQSQVRILDDD